MLFLGQAQGSVSLGLPSGQVVTAQGQLPFPEGSELLVRVLAGTGDAPVRLQTLQATPPAAPAILAPCPRVRPRRSWPGSPSPTRRRPWPTWPVCSSS